MKPTFQEFLNEQNLNESSLSRVHEHMTKHDTGFITAFRGKNSKSVNQQLNKQLKAKLLLQDYGVTEVSGAYIENYDTDEAKEVGENTFFVVDLNDKGNLKTKLKLLGEEYDQDSILFVPKGGTKGLLIGTNDAEVPGKDNENVLNNPVFGKAGEFHTKVNGRPFIFKESFDSVLQTSEKYYLSRLALREAAKSIIDYTL